MLLDFDSGYHLRRLDKIPAAVRPGLRLTESHGQSGLMGSSDRSFWGRGFQYYATVGSVVPPLDRAPAARSRFIPIGIGSAAHSTDLFLAHLVRYPGFSGISFTMG